ncbi:hypothetical protein J6590_108394 [Homalodisca vitripennis]|nr:hypothetical protein J6590_108394 [Homalodisca vitripennis]
MNVIKPVYKDLSDPKLLKRCLHGKTQNPNESFNSVIRSGVPKTAFVGLKTLQIGVNDSVISFNEGAIGKANVFQRLGITPGKFMIEELKKIDENRIKKQIKRFKRKIRKKG